MKTTLNQTEIEAVLNHLNNALHPVIPFEPHTIQPGSTQHEQEIARYAEAIYVMKQSIREAGYILTGQVEVK